MLGLIISETIQNTTETRVQTKSTVFLLIGAHAPISAHPAHFRKPCA